MLTDAYGQLGTAMQTAAKTLADELIDWDELLQCMSLVVVPKADKLRRKLVFIRS